MTLFFDTFVFIKRHIDEAGSREVEKLCHSADDVGVSMLLPIEAVAAFARLKREKRLTGRQAAFLKQELFQDLRDVTVITLTPAVVTATIKILEQSVIKSLDAIHVGCALEYQPDFFVSGDAQQLSGAVKAGLKVKRVV